MIGSPSNLELLLHCYYSSAPHPRYDAPAIQEGIEYLRKSEMIVQKSYIAGTRQAVWQTTDKGEAFVNHLMTIPFPEQHWLIPERQLASEA